MSNLHIARLDIPAVLLIETVRHADDRGWLSVTYNARDYAEAGIADDFTQENQSFSQRVGTVRGLHYQRPPKSQAKLVRVLTGRILDVALDLRQDSPTFRRHVAVELSAANGKQLYVPHGFAHGFVTREEDTIVHYKLAGDYDRSLEGGIAWDDPDLGIDWGIASDTPVVISDRDQKLPRLRHVETPFTSARLLA